MHTRTQVASAVLVGLLVVLAGCSATLAGGQSTPESAPIRADPPAPASDRLGWEAGIWYNETLPVDGSDGLNDTERRLVVARTMARIEFVRRLEFRHRVPVRVLSRERFRAARGGRSVPPAERRFENAKYEALFMINESTDALAVQRRTGEVAISGFYSPARDAIVLIAERGGRTPRIDELTLAHELMHALQDQHFGLGGYERPTREKHNAVDGLIEGDANYVQHRYERRCRGSWNGTCVTPPKPADGGAGSLANVGPFILRYQPYSDGPVFVRSLRREGGWDAVNAAYDDPPASTEQTIHPSLYGRDPPTAVAVPDRSSDDWRRLRVRGPDYAKLGEAGLFSMLVYPALATQGQAEVIPARSFFAGNGGLDPYNYSHPYTAGWDGDRLVVYVNDDTPPNETGYVWKSVWDDERQAEAFARGYRKLLKLHGARPVEGRADTWVIPEGNEFADAFYVEQRGKRVVVVNAPTVEQLSEVRARSGGRAPTTLRSGPDPDGE